MGSNIAGRILHRLVLSLLFLAPVQTVRRHGSHRPRMAAALWVIAVLSKLTVIHRVLHTYQQSRRLGTQAPTT